MIGSLNGDFHLGDALTCAGQTVVVQVPVDLTANLHFEGGVDGVQHQRVVFICVVCGERCIAGVHEPSLRSDGSVEVEAPGSRHEQFCGIPVFVGTVKGDVSKPVVADGGDRHVRKNAFGNLLQQLHGDVDADQGGQVEVGSVRISGNRQRLTQGFGVVCVVEGSHDDEPFARRDVGGKGAVLIRTEVEPIVLCFVVQEEVVGDAVTGCVHERTGNEIGVLQGNFVRVVNCVETDAKGVEELLTDKVVVGCVLVGWRRSVEHQVVSAWSE